MPTMREMRLRKEDWPNMVTDWELFWTRLTVWQQYVERSRRKRARPSDEYEEWWELDTADTEARKQKVKEVQEVCQPANCSGCVSHMGPTCAISHLSL